MERLGQDMYRQYENPRELEKKLEEVKESIRDAIDSGARPEDLESLYETKADLTERINFAWQDEEYDENER